MQSEYETLKNGFKLYISKTHRFGTDAFLLAHFSRPQNEKLVFDLCTGCGIVAFLIAQSNNLAKIYTLELQREAVDLSRKTALKNNLGDRVELFEGDLKVWQSHETNGNIDLVTCNPPYKTLGSGLICKSQGAALSRHEIACNIEDVCKAASRLLKPTGRLCLCQRADRLIDTLNAMRKHKIEPKRLQFVSHRLDTAPWMFLIEGSKGRGAYLKIDPALFIEADDGEVTQRIKEIYGKC